MKLASNIWPFRRLPTRKMIPFPAKGVVTQFRCSECDWFILLESPFLYHDRRSRAAATKKAEGWYSAHDCSLFQKQMKVH
jgi:hypothetical protein